MFESKQHALAYLIGVYLSDGSLNTYTGAFGLNVKDKEFRDTTAEALKTMGTKSGQGRDKRGFYRLWEKSPYRVGWRLEDIFPNGKEHLPYIPDNLARDLVAGIMDGDGGIWPIHKGTSCKLVVCGHCEYLADLQTLFAAHDVLMHYRPRGCNHTINLRSFVKAGFYFRMPRKQVLLEAYKNGYHSQN